MTRSLRLIASFAALVTVVGSGCRGSESMSQANAVDDVSYPSCHASVEIVVKRSEQLAKRPVEVLFYGGWQDYPLRGPSDWDQPELELVAEDLTPGVYTLEIRGEGMNSVRESVTVNESCDAVPAKVVSMTASPVDDDWNEPLVEDWEEFVPGDDWNDSCDTDRSYKQALDQTTAALTTLWNAHGECSKLEDFFARDDVKVFDRSPGADATCQEQGASAAWMIYMWMQTVACDPEMQNSSNPGTATDVPY